MIDNDDTMKIPAPPHIRKEWLQGDMRRTIMDAAGTSLVTFDPVTRSGGVFRIESGTWSVIGPIALHEFAAALKALDATLPDVHALHVWLDAVTDCAPAGATRQ